MKTDKTLRTSEGTFSHFAAQMSSYIVVATSILILNNSVLDIIKWVHSTVSHM